jgi:cold shock CspA family protein
MQQDTLHEGIVTYYDATRHFGFIQARDGTRFFFHDGQILTDELYLFQQVRFSIQPDPNGRYPHANNVTPIEG